MYTQASLAPTHLAPDTLEQGYMECSNLLRELIDMEQGGQLGGRRGSLHGGRHGGRRGSQHMVADMAVNKVADISCSN